MSNNDRPWLIPNMKAVQSASGVRPVIDPNKPSRICTKGVADALAYVSEVPKQFLSETQTIPTVSTTDIINERAGLLTEGSGETRTLGTRTLPVINSGQPHADIFILGGEGSNDAESAFPTKYRPKVASEADASGLKIEHGIAPSTLDGAYSNLQTVQSAPAPKIVPVAAQKLPKSNQELLDVRVQQLGAELQTKMAGDPTSRNIVRDVHDFAISLRSYQNKLYNTRVGGFLPTTKGSVSTYIESSDNPALKMLEKLPAAKPKHLAAAAEISKDERLLGVILGDTRNYGEEALKFLHAFREHPEVLSKYVVKA